jgi:putative DNA primase/helicase
VSVEQTVVFRYLLAVPYAQRELAKGVGARWDPVIRRWWVPANHDLRNVAAWSPRPVHIAVPREHERRPTYGRTGRPVRTYR